MPSTVSCRIQSGVTVTQTFTGGGISSADNTVTHNAFNEDTTLTASTTYPATKATAYEITLSSGTATINLASLTGLTTDEAVVGTGLKIQAIKFINKSTNANSMTIAKGASNGHTGLGSAFSVTIYPGGGFLWTGADGGADIGSSDRTIDVSGTGSQVLQFEVVMG